MINLSSKRVTNWLKTNWLDLIFSTVILVITSFIAVKNYTPGTYLTGWDNLHPEFNFRLNIERSINAVWQEYQGVGVLGGMSHAADLPRQIFLWITSFVLPVSLTRYFWTFLMLFIGPLGVYFLLKDKSKIGAFTASIFYIFNLATVQYFFVPFETFTGFFGFLPWLIYTANRYLDSGKGLVKYAVVSFLATSAFYVQTLFVVYGIFLLFLSLKNINRAFKLFLTTFFVNAFWLLPVLWFTLTSGNIPSNSDINRIASPETIFMNQGRADFTNITNLKGYWYDYYDFGKDQKFDYLFRPWIDYSSKPYIKEIGIGLFVVSVLGLVLSRQFIWLLLLGIGYLMLSGFKIPISVLEEAFRNSFTKWSVAFSFVISVGLGYFVTSFRLFSKKWIKKLGTIAATIIIFTSIYSVYPIIDGKLISERVKVNIPNVYFESFDWFNKQSLASQGPGNTSDGNRVAYFPAFDKWGWNYHDWGYGGSGFIWYGIRNPILDRAFNVWSPSNESYYNEVTKAILDNDQELFKNTINKYQVKYLFLDGSVVFPWGDKDLLKLETVRSFSESLGYKKVFTKDFIEVYDTQLTSNNFITAVNSYASIDADLIYSKTDSIYQKYGNYIQVDNGLGLPFVNFEDRGPVEIKIVDGQLMFLNKTTRASAKLQINERITETFDPTHGYQETINCDLRKAGSVERELLENSRRYLAANGAVSCDYFVYSTLNYSQAYVMHVKGQNKQGRSLKLYLFNWQSKRVELEELLPVSTNGEFDSYYVVYPKNNVNPELSAGYTLNIETRSFGTIASENVINEIEFIPFDIKFITDLYVNPKVQQMEDVQNDLQILSVKKYGTAIYEVKTSGSGILQLGQGFEEGWTSYPKLEHSRLNTWSNAFIVKANDQDVNTFIVYFWPQLLEWGALVLLLCVTCILTIVSYLVKSKKLSN